MKKLRILFMGTPEFAVPSLKALVESGHAVVGVVTSVDKPSGRGQKPKYSEVKEYALSEGLHILQPEKMKNPDFLAHLESLDIDLAIVVAFRMLPKEVWALPKYGTLNLHGSLLPNYRGAAPINWAIINGETQTGNTTFFLNENIDTGPIILQEKYPIAPQDTFGSVYKSLMEMGANLVLKTVEAIAQSPNLKTELAVQPKETHLKEAPKIDKAICRIYWDNLPQDINNLIRGLSPYPGAWASLKHKGVCEPIKIYSAEAELAAHKFKIGSIHVGKTSVKVAVRGGFVCLKTIQLPNRNRMDIKDALNGLRTLFEEGEMA